MAKFAARKVAKGLDVDPTKDIGTKGYDVWINIHYHGSTTFGVEVDKKPFDCRFGRFSNKNNHAFHKSWRGINSPFTCTPREDLRPELGELYGDERLKAIIKEAIEIFGDKNYIDYAFSRTERVKSGKFVEFNGTILMYRKN